MTGGFGTSDKMYRWIAGDRRVGANSPFAHQLDWRVACPVAWTSAQEHG
jgi:hypothetical protein